VTETVEEVVGSDPVIELTPVAPSEPWEEEEEEETPS
jgi:hypothetical protein